MSAPVLPSLPWHLSQPERFLIIHLSLPVILKFRPIRPGSALPPAFSEGGFFFSALYVRFRIIRYDHAIDREPCTFPGRFLRIRTASAGEDEYRFDEMNLKREERKESP
jgi:hypothetical protein